MCSLIHHPGFHMRKKGGTEVSDKRSRAVHKPAHHVVSRIVPPLTRYGFSYWSHIVRSFLAREGGPGGRNVKREAKNKKYGFGGKKREKGQSDPRSLNDLSQYNPKQGGSGRSRSVSFLANFFASRARVSCRWTLL